MNLNKHNRAKLAYRARSKGVSLSQLANTKIAQALAIEAYLGPKKWAALIIEIEEIRLKEIAFSARHHSHNKKSLL